MTYRLSRRDLLASLSLTLMPRLLFAAEKVDIASHLRAIEHQVGGRLGVAALDTGNNHNIDYNATDLWPLCSTFKFLLVGAILNKVDTGQERIDRMVSYGQRDLLDYAPVTRSHVSEGQMKISELCEAAICYSDNTAANLLFPLVGGPEGVTRYIRTLGDKVTTLNRIEPFLNEARPHDIQDTTSPAAMIQNMQSLLVRDALSPSSRSLLIGWLKGNTTGNERLRAMIPSSWLAGDKTGTGEYGSTNDIAIFWPPRRSPLLIAAYLTESQASINLRNAALAKIGDVIVNMFKKDAF